MLRKHTPSAMPGPPSPPSTKFRAIAREAVIFVLIGTALALIAGFVWAFAGARSAARSAAAIRLHAVDLRWTKDTSWFPEPPIEKRVKVPLTNGTVLFVADFAKVHANDDRKNRSFTDHFLAGSSSRSAS
jgi:hypothetical protein